MDLERLEALALSHDRDAALAGLLPGTVEHDYWRGVHLQHRGRLAEVDAILAAWRPRHRSTDEHHDRLARRQLLLRAGLDLAACADPLRFAAGLDLDDQADAIFAAQRHPTRLDPALLAEPALLQAALERADDLTYVRDGALADLVHLDLDPARRRHLLQRLPRANFPELVAMIAADLDERSSRGFGGLPVHDRLSLAQLDQLAALRPALRDSPAWVSAVLKRLRPPAHLDWHIDLTARRYYLGTLWAFVAPLSASFNALKAQVLYHQLDLDHRQDIHDRPRFLRYLALPRKVHYAHPEPLRGLSASEAIEPGLDAAPGTGLPAIGDDEPLVRAYLEHFLRTEDTAAFAGLLRADWLESLLATTRLLAGAPDPDRWAALLGPAPLAALRDRVDIELTASNPAHVPAHAPVVLELDLKNVPQLVIKTFRVDPVAYFLARQAEVDTAIDLDGLVASDEQTLRSDLPAIQRQRRRIELPGCARPGTYVIELLGNGKSSRALIRKGGLRHTVRVGAAGPTIRVYDEHGRPLTDATLWLGGREYGPRDDGAISIPFSTAPTRARMLLVHGDVAQLETLTHPAEHYQFTAGIHLERESLIPGKRAHALVRAQLRVAGWPVPLALIDDPRLDISVTDRGGTTSLKTQPIELHDHAETLVELHVPEDLAALTITVRGHVRVVSTQQTIELADSSSAAVNQIHAGPQTAALHLASTAQGHALRLLGKTGEPRGGRAVALAFKHRAVTFDITLTLETDEHGRIELGDLAGVERLTASVPSGAQRSWTLRPELDLPRQLHHLAGEVVTLPRPPGASPDATPSHALSELRGGAVARDCSAHLELHPHALVIRGDLDPGEYLLQRRDLPDLRLILAPAAAIVADGHITAGPLTLQRSPLLPALDAWTLTADLLRLQIRDAGPATRVHLLATRYLPDRALPSSLRRAPHAPQAVTVPPVRSHYISGRDIGDEHRYVLERRGQPRRPGLLLDKPSLLLSPWALRSTRSVVQRPSGGASYGASPARPSPPPAPGQARPPGDLEPDSGADTSLDFLPEAAVLLANLRPDERGEIVVPRAQLGPAQHLRLVLVDPALTTVLDLPLPARELAPRDLRLRLALDHDGHFREERRIDGVLPGAQLVVDDIRAGKLELVDTLARAHQMLLALGASDTLRAFAFLTTWHTLDDAARRARYAKFACHELHLFLYFHDPEFFAAVIRPYLAHKRQRTFIDHWLLGDDLSAYRDPWAFGRLNALERVLLARRIPALAAGITRLLGDHVDLIPPDPERDARRVDALLGASALEGGSVATSAAAFALATMSLDDPRDARGPDHAALPVAMELGEAPAQTPAPMSLAAPRMAARQAASGGAARNQPEPEQAAADLRQRKQAAPLFRGADRTQEWADTDWWELRLADTHPDLIAGNRYWRDFASHDPAAGPFLSPYLGECLDSFAAAMCALAVLGLPFVAGAHPIHVDDPRLTLTCASPALAARTRVVPATLADPRAQVLVGQSYFRADDRWAWDGPEQREKHLDGELLVDLVYQCQVVVTNPTSRPQKLAVLLQIPRGAVPVDHGFYTRTIYLQLHAYATHALEYAFYFPHPGTWTHFPAHVTLDDQLVAFAAPTTLTVLTAPSHLDATSWAHVSQHGSLDDVLHFLAAANLERLDLTKIAWRMHQRDPFTRVLALLDARLHYDDRLWAYAFKHADRLRVAQWLRHHDDFIRPAGPVLQGGILDLDPLLRGWYQHLEYAPLINARAHPLGARRQIANDALAGHYREFLELLAHRAAPTADDLLAAAHYLFTLDRIDDALAVLARVDRHALHTQLQYDYLAAYAACCQGDLPRARQLAAPWLSHPVDRWRDRFLALTAMLDEAEALTGPAAVLDPDSRAQRMDAEAARQPALDLRVDHGLLVLQHQNLARCQLRFYRMDIELLFSRQPFVSGEVERFSWIDPGAQRTVELAKDGRTSLDLPADMRGANLVIEAVAPGLRRAVTHYAHDLAPQLIQQYGQLRVLRASTQAPLPGTYVKVYARQPGGAINFYKDGYTDLRGRFDYATLSTDDLDRVERFAILIASDDAGATILEAPPPPR